MTLFNAAEYLVDRQDGGRTAVVTAGRTLTYAELAAEVRAVAAGLRARGVRPEERVLMCMVDGIELYTAILGAMYAGAIAVPCSTMLTGPELRKLVLDSRARMVLGSRMYAPAVTTAVEDAPDVTEVIFDDEWDLIGQGSLDSPYPTWPDSPALWLYTSGTTGEPKAAMHSHQDIRVVAETYGQQVLGVRPDDRCLSVAKLFFAYGLGNSMFFPLSVGAAAVLQPSRPTGDLIARLTADAHVTLLFGTPSFWGPVLASQLPSDSFSTVRQGISAGEALPPRMYHGMLDRFGVEVLDGIGSTELLHIFLSNRPGEVRPASSGVPVPGYEIALRDEHGSLITEPGVSGELYVKGESAATGYWCRTSASRRVFLGDWTRTGDTYVRNDDGTYSSLGRTGDMLKAGGIWVTPSEVENRLLEHPAVAEVAVVGVPDEDGLDRAVACVVGTPGEKVDEDELIQWCRDGLASFKRPRRVIEMTDLPRTATGKVRRNVLREIAGQVGSSR
ncbi:benzoate-CoA ligase family protein [Actinocrispum wychmicini]|uniref:Benzoate-CoA ligase n=1 Tax=Actinocrispum wychmicini TaxID=1213861 RepID=A0A4V2S683_9PSEU|nr:benzoate-CoA ligase family protein [Actinocrispum wychmicini]TCO55010.1 benzoate-CoA ligase [Actinocrispum wychmicini]